VTMSPGVSVSGSLPPVEVIVDRIGRLEDRLDLRSDGRTRLLPVTKAFPVEAVAAVRRAGVREVGENYAQELLAKCSELDDPTVGWHMVGGLQRNKVRLLAPVVTLWQTVDRVELLEEIARRAPGARVLVQVDTHGSEGRSGCTPAEVEGLVGVGVDRGLEVVGLMTVGVAGDPSETRRAFQVVSGLAESLGLRELSMGMTYDLDLAVDHGSTLVRVGRAIFGERPAG